MKKKEEILAYWVRHEIDKRHYFKWSWNMVWIIIKYMIIKRKKIYFTVTKAYDREEYLIQFFAE